MKLHTLLALSLSLPLVTACGDDVDAAANEAGEAVGGMMDTLRNLSIDDIENSATAEKVQDVARATTDWMAKQLNEVEDAADAEALKQKMQPVLDKLGAMKDRLGDSLPGEAEIESALNSVKEQFSADGEVMQTLQPMIDKIEALFS